MTFDIAIIGGGIVGAATLYKLQKKHPHLKIILFEKESELAGHQTGHNSGVIHSGLYYKPGSLKAKNCIEGRHELVAFCKEHDIAHDVCGKVVVAIEEKELPNLDKIYQTGLENKIEGLKKLTPDQIKEIEPEVEGIAGLLVPCTGIVDFPGATKKMVECALEIQEHSQLKLNTEVLSIQKEKDQTIITTSAGDFKAKNMIFCAGLQADRLAKKDQVKLKEKIVGFRGDY